MKGALKSTRASSMWMKGLLKFELRCMRVTEIFHSIQGESSHAGRPCVFVRLTGCNLRCVWCDSEYTFTGGERMSIEEIVARVKATGASWSR
jgi:organic radical activating enzyme